MDVEQQSIHQISPVISMAGKVLIFTGAPESCALDWNPTGLLKDFQHQIIQFIALDRTRAAPSSHVSVSAEPSSAPAHALWRSVSLEKQHVSTGFSQLAHNVGVDFGPAASFASFISTESISVGGSNPDGSDLYRQGQQHERESQFYEHSLAIHEDVTSSQLVSSQSQSLQDTATSFQTDDSAALASFQSGDSLSQAPTVKAPLPFPGGDISNLKDRPSAAYITKIQPQTMTRNLIVGIISVSRPREVKTRWGTRAVVDLIVGDETEAGFAITFWLAPNSTVDESDLAGLRSGDIILVRNVALTAFMKKVSGSSLRNLTRIHLLHRARLEAQDVSGYYKTSDLRVGGVVHSQLAKTQRVWNWVVNFVSGGRPGKANKRKTSAAESCRPSPWDRPPLDTQ